jgi:hypothetical protein
VPTRDPLRPHVERDAGVVVGRVTRSSPDGLYLRVNGLAGELGPCIAIAGAYAAGDPVAATPRFGAPGDYVVVGKLGPGAASDPDL